MKILDRSKPFQEVIGDDPSIKHRFVQDGVKFDNQGNEIVTERAKKAADPESDTGQTGETGGAGSAAADPAAGTGGTTKKRGGK